MGYSSGGLFRIPSEVLSGTNSEISSKIPEAVRSGIRPGFFARIPP